MDKIAYSKNVASTSLAEAKEIGESYFKKPVEEVLGRDFDKKYMKLQRATKGAPGIPRIQMPVIEPKDIQLFQQRLNEGKVDIIAPWAKGHFVFPSETEEGDPPWVELGFADGSLTDDKLRAGLKGVAGAQLKPTQNQIWLEKLFKNMASFGVPKSGSRILTTTTIVSSDMFILDGHHRYGQLMLADPSLKMTALLVPMPIKKLLEIGRAYGEAIGNPGKQAHNKIASPTQLQTALQGLLVYCQATSNPSRQVLATEMRKLADRL